VFRDHGRRCWSCRWWRSHYPQGDCRYCERHTRVGELGACRLCIEQARLRREPGRALDPPTANQFGQQLFLANMRYHRPRTPRLRPPARHERHASARAPVGWRQERLFHIDPDAAAVRRRVLAADPDLLADCREMSDI
jgi:hypothetical protein